jgi:glycosyltransferase involved in cell wall biosynthesis
MVDVSIVIPCLNEAQSLEHCISNARTALFAIQAKYGLEGEIIVADNGSEDGSQDIARNAGARVVDVPRRGYGAALIGGFTDAHGRYLVMGDADGSYNFLDCVPMIGQLQEGADLCMGSRFAGGITPGAMPWKNRYIGNPFLTAVLNLFFRSGIEDAHCGIRAITADAFRGLQLNSDGMEFASEMVVKASLKRLRIAEVPATLSPDLRDRPPHLRPWRDGWRHLRYLVMLSPTWAFGVPAIVGMGIGAIILLAALASQILGVGQSGPIGTSWIIVAGFSLTCGHFAALMAVAMHLQGVREGYRVLRPSLRRFAGLFTLETCVVAGLALIVAAIAGLATVAYGWSAGGFAALPSVLPLVLSAAAGVIGFQTMFGGIVLAIIGGHSAAFLRDGQQAVPASVVAGEAEVAKAA